MTQSLSTSKTSFYSTNTLQWLALLALILIALLSYNNQSTRGDETGGSGLGGTGRSSEPGSESGLGGTGFRPFIGSNTSAANPDSSDLSVIQPQVVLSPDATIVPLSASLDLATEHSIPPPDMPVPRVIEIVPPAAMTRDSGAIDINEQIQHNLDSQVLVLEQSAHYRAEELEGYVQSPSLADAEMDVPVTEPNHEQGVTEAATAPDPDVTGLNWSELASALSSLDTGPELDSGAAPSAPGLEPESGIDAARIDRPERVVRPSLPPVQRVRPLQRIGILPPRIRPLSL